MSHLHKRIKAHEHMSPEQKKSCTCDLCKGLNVYKRDRVKMSIQKSRYS